MPCWVGHTSLINMLINMLIYGGNKAAFTLYMIKWQQGSWFPEASFHQAVAMFVVSCHMGSTNHITLCCFTATHTPQSQLGDDCTGSSLAIIAAHLGLGFKVCGMKQWNGASESIAVMWDDKNSSLQTTSAFSLAFWLFPVHRFFFLFTGMTDQVIYMSSN